MSWFNENFETTEQDFNSQQEEYAKKSVRRVWIKPGTAIDVLFVDERAFAFDEHRYKVGDNWNNFVTCLGLRNGCPFCEGGHEPDRVTIFTVIDLSEWTDKRGVVHKNEKKILAVKTQAAKLLMDKKKSWGGLQNKLVKIRRTGDKDAASGSDFELMMRDGKVLQPNLTAFKDLTPFDYMKLFAPMSKDDLIAAWIRVRGQQGSSAAVPVDGGAAQNSAPAQAHSSAPATMSSQLDEVLPF